MELISREAAIHEFDGVKVSEENCTEYDIGYNDGIDFAVSRLSVITPIEERKKGKWMARWIPKPELGWGETYICSECGEKTTSTVMGKPRYNYCPMCGADMRGKEDE